jgi:hypothetical protein
LRNYRFLAIFVVAALGFAMPALAEVFSTPTGEEQVRVCVNKKDNLVRYFNKRDSCPANSRELVLNKEGRPGVDGSNGSPGANGNDIYRNCFQKRQAAIAAGAILASKRDREYFERQTGCIVEEIKDEEFINAVSASGIPVVTDWNLVSVDIIRACGGAYIIDFACSGTSTYEVTIGNYDAISDGGGQFTFCLPLSYETDEYTWSRGFQLFTQIDGETFQVETSLSTNPTKLVSPMSLGFADGRNCTVLVVPSTGPFEIHVDPESVLEQYLWPGWGW